MGTSKINGNEATNQSKVGATSNVGGYNVESIDPVANLRSASKEKVEKKKSLSERKSRQLAWYEKKHALKMQVKDLKTQISQEGDPVRKEALEQTLSIAEQDLKNVRREVSPFQAFRANRACGRCGVDKSSHGEVGQEIIKKLEAGVGKVSEELEKNEKDLKEAQIDLRDKKPTKADIKEIKAKIQRLKNEIHLLKLEKKSLEAEIGNVKDLTRTEVELIDWYARKHALKVEIETLEKQIGQEGDPVRKEALEQTLSIAKQDLKNVRSEMDPSREKKANALGSKYGEFVNLVEEETENEYREIFDARDVLCKENQQEENAKNFTIEKFMSEGVEGG